MDRRLALFHVVCFNAMGFGFLDPAISLSAMLIGLVAYAIGDRHFGDRIRTLTLPHSAAELAAAATAAAKYYDKQDPLLPSAASSVIAATAAVPPSPLRVRAFQFSPRHITTAAAAPRPLVPLPSTPEEESRVLAFLTWCLNCVDELAWRVAHAGGCTCGGGAASTPSAAELSAADAALLSSDATIAIVQPNKARYRYAVFHSTFHAIGFIATSCIVYVRYQQACGNVDSIA